MEQEPIVQGEHLPEIAFYYPNPFWHDGNWIKNLLLFFDGIALLVPKYMKRDIDRYDPKTVPSLMEKGLLHILEPETLVNKAATENLASAMTDIITSGALDPLAKDGSKFAELSYSRLGGYGDEELAAMIHNELIKRGLAKKTVDGVSVPMHPKVRSLVLVLLAQILREPGRKAGFDLVPSTDRPEIVTALRELLSLPSIPSAGHVVSFDLKVVGVNVESIPIDEVLSFRQENLGLYRNYVRSVQRFVHDLSTMPIELQSDALEDRKAKIEDLAVVLRRESQKAWKNRAAFAIGIAGAAWTLKNDDPIGAALAGIATLLAADLGKSIETGAFSYLFDANRKFS